MSKERIFIGDTEGGPSEDRPTEYMDDFGPSGVSGETVAIRKKQSSQLAYLILVKGDAARFGTPFRLNDDVTSIGRAADNDIVLDDELVSKQHAKVRFEDNAFVLYDLVTVNGTGVNGDLIKNRKEIKENDKIQVGDILFVFKKV